MKAHTTATEQERAALAGWYPEAVAPKMEALFASASEEAYEEYRLLQEPTFAEFGEAKRAARLAAWAIIRRAQDAAAVARGGAR